MVLICLCVVQDQNMTDSSEWQGGIGGNFPIHKAVVEGEGAIH